MRGRSNRAARRIRQRPVRQERSARPSADAIPSRCSKRRAFLRMAPPRSRSRIMFLRSSPAARRNRPAEPAWMVAPQLGSIRLPQRRLPTAKLVCLRARPHGLMQRVRQNSALRSAQSLRRTAAQKSRYPRQRHSPTAKLVHPRTRPRGRMRRVQRSSVLRSAHSPHRTAAQKSRRRRLSHTLPLVFFPTDSAENRQLRFQRAA